MINTIESTCTKKGTKNFECKICNIKDQESLDLIPHEYNYSFPDSKKKECKGTCKFCNKTIYDITGTVFIVFYNIKFR